MNLTLIFSVRLLINYTTTLLKVPLYKIEE